MSWRPARSLVTLRGQLAQRHPYRSTAADGMIGDTAHSRRQSDHNADARGIVRAFDITHDPAHGCDAHNLAEHLLQEQDPRLKYLISNGRIGSGPAGPRPGVWRPYKGNPHDKHVHISVVADDRADDPAEWSLPGVRIVPPTLPKLREPEDDDMPLSDDDVERIAVRTAAHVANGKNRHGTDNLFRLLVQLIAAVEALPGKVVAAMKVGP